MMDQKTRGLDFRLLARLIRLMKPHVPLVAAAVAALILGALGTLSLPLILQKAVDGPLSQAASPQGWELLHSLGLTYLVVLLGTMLASFAQIYLLALVGQKVMVDLRTRLFSHFLSKPLSWLQTQPTGKLVSGITGDVATISDFFNTLFTSLLKDLAVMGGVIAALFTLNPTLATWTTLTLVPAAFILTFFRLNSRRAFRRSRTASAKIQSFLHEYLGGMSLVQLFGQEKKARGDFGRDNQELLKANLGELYVNALFRPMIDLLASLSLGVLLWLGTGMVLEHTVTLGVLIAYVGLLNQFYQPLGSLAENFSQLQSALAGSERVFGYLEEESRVEDSGRFFLEKNHPLEVEFQNLKFSYNPGEPVLRGLDMAIPAGTTAALVGYTGAGKTTVTNLLTRFWEPQEGRILLAGRDIRDYSLTSLRQGVQSVLQDVVLFSGTVRENLTLGRAISQEELDEVADQVKMLDIIRSLPQGWDTELGEGAAILSSGQRQLLSFARVLLQNPGVLVLDEATAHIDTETEVRIQQALDVLLRGRTSLVIAHRLSTIRHAHRIFVLDQGICKESGTHEELMALKGFYYNLYKLQYEKQPAS